MCGYCTSACTPKSGMFWTKVLWGVPGSSQRVTSTRYEKLNHFSISKNRDLKGYLPSKRALPLGFLTVVFWSENVRTLNSRHHFVRHVHVNYRRMVARSARFIRRGRVWVIPQWLQKGTCGQRGKGIVTRSACIANTRPLVSGRLCTSRTSRSAAPPVSSQSEPIRANQSQSSQSEPIRANQSQSEPI
jgi:hypothetical protein